MQILQQLHISHQQRLRFMFSLPMAAILIIYGGIHLTAQTDPKNYSRDRLLEEEVEPYFEERLQPFYHGVASGDPLPDRVILWTRVTPENEGEISVDWRIATDPQLQNVVGQGTVMTSVAVDYTVKVDAEGLQAGTTYYYGFTALGRHSLTGRTKTAPSGSVAKIRLAVMSCSNYAQGYFNAYRHVAERNDLDVVLHLGDYIYEYGKGDIDDLEEKGLAPEHEVIALADYRIRHSFYKLDPDLRRAHQQHPFIVVWDDHEFANNSYKDGAQNHTPGVEGDWEMREADAIRAFHEWLPIRVESLEQRRIYRDFSYGDLADIIMLDTRSIGREQQIDGAEIDTAMWQAPERTILGTEQFDWLQERLLSSSARWKLLGNQVMMMHAFLSPNKDSWDGYPAERTKILEFFRTNAIDNIVVLTGDIHASWSADLSVDPFDSTVYNPATGAGAVAVEFVTPSITTFNLNEILNEPPRSTSLFLERQLKNTNPHIKFIELDSHGYMIVDIDANRVQSDWYFVDTLRIRQSGEQFAQGWFTLDGANKLDSALAAAPDIPNPPAPAPDDPPLNPSGVGDPDPSAGVMVVGNYPNPARDLTRIHYVLSRAESIEIAVYNTSGVRVAQVFKGALPPGVYGVSVDLSALPSGVYSYEVATKTSHVRRSLVVVR